MTHKGTMRLETQDLILRKFKIEDSECMYINWATSPNVTKFLTWYPHENQAQTESVLSSWAERYSSTDFYQWAIELKSIKEPIGSMSVVRIDEGLNEVEIGYCIGEKWWGKGLTAQAFKAVIAFLFDQVKVDRICAKHDVENPNSGKVMQKCGLKRIGIFEKAGVNITNGICDVVKYIIERKK